MAQMNWNEMKAAAEKDGGFAPHPIGSYRFKVTEANIKPGSTGNPMILARLENIDAGPNQGKTVLNNMAPLKNDGTPNGMFFQQLGALGFPNDHPIWQQIGTMDLAQGVALIATNILGKEAVCEITHRDHNGIRDNVKSMKSIASAPAVGGVPAAAPVAAAPAAAPVAPAPAPVAAAPLPVAPVPLTPAAPADIVVEPTPVAPAVLPVAPAVVEAVAAPVVAATEPVAVPTTEEAVVAQIPQPPVAPVPTPPSRPF